MTKVIAYSPAAAQALRNAAQMPLQANRRAAGPRPAGYSAGSAYEGQFKIQSGSTTNSPWIEVVNGTLTEDDREDSPAGQVNVGGSWHDVDYFLSSVTGSGYVYVIVSYEYEGDASTPTYSAEIKTAANLPNELVDGVYSYVVQLGTYTVTGTGEDAAITTVQTWQNGSIAVTGVAQ